MQLALDSLHLQLALVARPASTFQSPLIVNFSEGLFCGTTCQFFSSIGVWRSAVARQWLAVARQWPGSGPAVGVFWGKIGSRNSNRRPDRASKPSKASSVKSRQKP